MDEDQKHEGLGAGAMTMRAAYGNAPVYTGPLPAHATGVPYPPSCDFRTQELVYRLGQHTLYGPFDHVPSHPLPPGGHWQCRPKTSVHASRTLSGLEVVDRRSHLPYPMGMLGSLGRTPYGGRDGFGSIGPLGNAATIEAGTYKITGSGVNFRNASLQPSGGTLNIGDDFTADGNVKGTEANGVYTNFASGTSKLGSGYVAVEYLAPAGGFNPAAYHPEDSGGGAAIPASITTTKTTVETTTQSEWTDYVPYVLGALAVGGIGYALFFTKPGKVTRRYARAKYHAHKRRRGR